MHNPGLGLVRIVAVVDSLDRILAVDNLPVVGSWGLVAGNHIAAGVVDQTVETMILLVVHQGRIGMRMPPLGCWFVEAVVLDWK